MSFKHRAITFEEKEAFYRARVGGPSGLTHTEMDGTERPYTDAEWSDWVRCASHPDCIDETAPDLEWIGKRVGAYPDDDDQFGALWKAIKAIRDAQSITMPDEVNEMITLIDNIKSQFPKPS